MIKMILKLKIKDNQNKRRKKSQLQIRDVTDHLEDPTYQITKLEMKKWWMLRLACLQLDLHPSRKLELSSKLSSSPHQR
jgi:hypothetical protein